jgi:DNA-binding transcriptional MerR regulator
MQGTKYNKIPSSRTNKRQQLEKELPLIPDKRYFTIGEVGVLCGVKPHVLRYWEQEFSQLKPAKRRGNRRFYQYEDVLMIRKIRKLLYENGFTIEGARAQLIENPAEVNKSVQTDAVVKKMIADLENVLQRLKSEEIV